MKQCYNFHCVCTVHTIVDQHLRVPHTCARTHARVKRQMSKCTFDNE